MMIPMLPQYRSFLLLGYPLFSPLYGRYIINEVFLPFLHTPKSRFRTLFPSSFRTPLQTLYGRYIINEVFLPFLHTPKSRFRTRFPSTFRTPLQGIKLFPCLSTVLLSTTRDLPIYHHLFDTPPCFSCGECQSKMPSESQFAT